MAPKLSRDKLELIDDLLYKSKKPKQALKELDKWLKKVPGSAQLQILKAQSLLECHRYSESRALCEAVARQSDVVNDLNLINDLHFLRFRYQKLLSQGQLSSEPDIIQLWHTAAKVQRGRTGVLLQWYGVAVSCDHWEDAQLAMAALRKEDPSEPKYSFYYIAITHMLAEMQSSRDPIRSKLNNTLAYRLLETTFKQQLSKQEKAVGISSLTSQSLDLVIQIYMAQTRHEELLSLFDDLKLLKITEIGIKSWRILRIKFQLLEDQRRWEQLHALAIATIWSSDAKESDNAPNIASVEYTNHDLLVFKALVRSSREINDTEKLEETTKLLMGFQLENVPFFSKRNASIALMSLLIDLHRDYRIIEKLKSINLEMESLFSACLRHFRLFGHHICCFDDVVNAISELSVIERESYLREVKVFCKEKSFRLVCERDKREWLDMETNYLKLEYLLRISQPHLTTTSLDQFNAFLNNVFSVLRISRSQKEGQKRDLYFIIILALLKRLSLITNENHHKNFLFMQIICLLESSHKYESDDRQIVLLLARLYKNLGFGSAFMCTYQKLRIKDILYEPLAHIFYTRISLSHPFPISSNEYAALEENARDPYLGAVRIINKSIAAIDTINRLISDTHKTPIYNRLSEYVELKRKLNGSRTKQIVVIEKRRLSRFRNKICDENDLHETDTWLRHSNDERDLSCLPNYGHADNSALEKLIHSGPPPNDYWIALMMVWDETYSSLLSEPTFRTTDLDIAESVIQSQTNSQDLTENECEMSRGWLLLHSYVKSQMPCEGKVEVASMTQLLLEIIDFAEVRSEKIYSRDYSGRKLPDSADLEEIYLVLEYLRACSKIGQFHQILPKQNGSAKNDIPTKDQINAKMKDVKDQVDKLGLFISNWRNMLSRSPIGALAEQMQSGEYNDHLRELIGLELSESCAKSFLASALDGLDGLLRAASI